MSSLRSSSCLAHRQGPGPLSLRFLICKVKGTKTEIYSENGMNKKQGKSHDWLERGVSHKQWTD